MYWSWFHTVLHLKEIISFPVHFYLRYKLAHSGLMEFIEIIHSFVHSFIERSEYNSVNRTVEHLVGTSGM